MKRFELFAVIGALLGIILKIFLVTGGSFLFVISMTILSVYYFFRGFIFLRNNQHPGSQDVNTLDGGLLVESVIPNVPVSTVFMGTMPLSVVCIGVLFRVQFWPGSGISLLTGGVSSLIGLAVLFYRNRKAYSSSVRLSLIRLLVGVGMVALQFAIPGREMFKHFNGHYPNVENVKN